MHGNKTSNAIRCASRIRHRTKIIHSSILIIYYSIRKDVERLFGTLKFLFRWLLGPIHYQDLETINYTARVCVFLHIIDDIAPDLLAKLDHLLDLLYDPDLSVPSMFNDCNHIDPFPFTAPQNPMNADEVPNFRK